MAEGGRGPNDIIVDDPHTNETQLDGSAGAQANAPSSKAKSRRKQSSVQNHFDKVVEEVTKKIKAQSKYCHSILSYSLHGRNVLQKVEKILNKVGYRG